MIATTEIDPSEYDLPSLNADLAEMLRGAKSHAIRSYQRFAADEIRLPPGGKYPGEKLRMERQPVQRLLLQEMDRRHWLEIIVAAPSQSAKTFIAFDVPIAYHAAELREDVVVGVPDGDMVNDKWKKEIEPVFRASPTLRRLLPTTGSGSKGGRVRDSIQLTNGSWLRFMTVGGSDQSKAGFTARVVIATEAAAYSEGTETSMEAAPLEQMEARQSSWDWEERFKIVEGTVTLKDCLPWSLREASSKSRIVSPCPWCGEYISPERDDLCGWEEAENAIEAAEKARFYCPECGEAISDEDRRVSVSKCVILHGDQRIDRRGRIHGDLPQSRRLWFRWSGWHNLFSSTGSLAVDEWHAAQHERSSPAWENAEKKQCQFRWAVPYEPAMLDAIEVDPKEIVKRRADQLPRGILPDDTTHLAMGVDLGGKLGHWAIVAGRKNGTMHLPMYGTFTVHGNERKMKTSEAIKIAMEKFHRDVFSVPLAVDGGGVWPIQMMLVDAGWQTEAVFQIWAKLTDRARLAGWIPVFGRGSAFMEKQRYTAPMKKSKHAVEIGDHWHVGRNLTHRGWHVLSDSDYWKTIVHESLALKPGDPGSMTLYAGSDTEHRKLAQHISNEVKKQERDPKRGVIEVWERKGDQHWLDALHYGFVGLQRLGWRAKPGKGGASAT